MNETLRIRVQDLRQVPFARFQLRFVNFIRHRIYRTPVDTWTAIANDSSLKQSSAEFCCKFLMLNVKNKIKIWTVCKNYKSLFVQIIDTIIDTINFFYILA